MVDSECDILDIGHRQIFLRRSTVPTCLPSDLVYSREIIHSEEAIVLVFELISAGILTTKAVHWTLFVFRFKYLFISGNLLHLIGIRANKLLCPSVDLLSIFQPTVQEAGCDDVTMALIGVRLVISPAILMRGHQFGLSTLLVEWYIGFSQLSLMILSLGVNRIGRIWNGISIE
jgi:hypothetical protein